MCNIEQCSRCRHNFDNCGYYDHTNTDLCANYAHPIDNSKMFSHWYNFNGRIGRLEFGLTFIFSLVLYFILLMSFGRIYENIGITNEGSYTIMHIVSMIIPGYIMLAASVKRCHDTGKDVKKVISPAFVLIALLIFRGGRFITFFVALILTWGYLIFYKSEDGINDYGTNPSQVANNQIRNIEME